MQTTGAIARFGSTFSFAGIILIRLKGYNLSRALSHGTPKVSKAKLGYFTNAAFFNEELIINKFCSYGVNCGNSWLI